MAVKVKVSAPSLKSIQAELSKPSTQTFIANSVIDLTKKFIATGTSPVLGERRFVPYKDKDKYPGDKKNSRPVNLYLSGQMLDAITFRLLKNSIQIGIWDKDQRKKAETHMFGLNGVPQRKFLPVEQGDQFNVTIARSMRSLYEKIVRGIIKK